MLQWVLQWDREPSVSWYLVLLSDNGENFDYLSHCSTHCNKSSHQIEICIITLLGDMLNNIILQNLSHWTWCSALTMLYFSSLFLFHLCSHRFLIFELQMLIKRQIFNIFPQNSRNSSENMSGLPLAGFMKIELFFRDL